MQKKTNFTKGQLLTLILCFLLSMKGFYTLGTYFEVAFDSINWVPTEATILDSRVNKSWVNRSGPTYTPEITYRYVIDEKTYINDTLTLPVHNMTRDKAYSIISLYKEKQGIEIWTDPNDATRSVIKKPDFDFWFLLVYGVSSILFFCLFIWLLRVFRYQ